MKLLLKNFRCHKNTVIDLPDQGLVLLAGDNGVGKTTIFKALLFVLYGHMKKVCHWDESTCEVVLTQRSPNKEYAISIKRIVARPNKLVVRVVGPSETQKYSGDDAQSVINQFVGCGMIVSNKGLDNAMPMSATNFFASSFVYQRQKNSVISMTPADQLKFIESLAFDTEQHATIKERIKDRIKQLKSKIPETEGLISSLERNLQAKKKKLATSHQPSKEEIDEYADFNVKDIEDAISRLTKKTTKKRSEYKHTSDAYVEAQEEEKRQKKIYESITKLEAEIGVYKSKLDDIGQTQPSEDEINEKKEEVDRLQASISHLNTFKKYKELANRVRAYERQKKAEIQEEINNVNLLSEDELEALKATLKDLEAYRDSYVPVASSSKSDSGEYGQKVNDVFEKAIQELYEETEKIFPGKLTKLVGNISKLNDFLKVEKKKMENDLAKKIKELKLLEFQISSSKYFKNVLKCPCCGEGVKIEQARKTLKLVKPIEIPVASTSQPPVKKIGRPKKGEIPQPVKEIIVVKPNEDEVLASNLKRITEECDKLRNNIASIEIIISRIVSLANLTVCIGEAKNDPEPQNEEYEEKPLPDHEQIAELQMIIREHQTSKLKLESLQNELLSPQYLKTPFLLNDIKEAKRLKRSLPEKYSPITDEEYEAFTKKVDLLKAEIADMWTKRGIFSSNSREIRNRETSLQKLLANLPQGKRNDLANIEKTKDELFKKIGFITETLGKLKDESDDLNDTLRLVKSINIYVQSIKEIEETEEELSNLKKELDRLNRSLTGAKGLEDSAKEAEILSISKVINDINHHAEIYIETFFDRDVNVRLENIKVQKDITKLQIHTRVDYNGHTTLFENLSDGEQQKCELAFLLGVNDMLGGRVLVLDETVNNCDSDITLEIMECLRHLKSNHNKFNKLVLVVAHHVPTGIFDYIIDVAKCKIT